MNIKILVNTRYIKSKIIIVVTISAMHVCRNTSASSGCCNIISSQMSIKFNNSGHNFCNCSQLYIIVHSTILFLLLDYILIQFENMCLVQLDFVKSIGHTYTQISANLNFSKFLSYKHCLYTVYRLIHNLRAYKISHS